MPSKICLVNTLESHDNMELLHTRINNRRFPVHFHDTFVIELVIAGADVCDGTGLTAKSEQVFVHSPMAAHTGGPMNGRALEYKAIYPSLQTMERLTGESHSPIPPTSWVSDNADLRQSLRSFFRSPTSPAGTKDLIDVFKIVSEQVATVPSMNCESGCDANEYEMMLTKHHLIENCHRDVSISELSEVSLLSRFHLIRSFRKRFGITPRQFLISQRVLLAKKLLARGIPIGSAAQAAGFSDQSHLNRCFKRVSGFNPGQYARVSAKS